MKNETRINVIRNEIKTIRSGCAHRNIIRYYCSRKYSLEDELVFVDIAMELADTDLKKHIQSGDRDKSRSGTVQHYYMVF